MLRPRVIPCLLWKNDGLVKTKQFNNPVYIGDAINAIKIFNEKEVDELVILDIDVGRHGGDPDYQMIEEIASECFMPLGYGGGIRTVSQISKILSLGVEKILLQTAIVEDEAFVRETTSMMGSSTIVAVIDYKKNFWGKYKVTSRGATKITNWSPIDFARHVEQLGVGEILLQSVDRDGTMAGYDSDIVREVVKAVSIPVVCLGGAGKFSHVIEVLNDAGSSGAAAGSMFVFQGRHRAILISYPTEKVNSLNIHT